ncbi:MAG: tRNA (N(6)-L-threonylcarbamoyladenosine(37)-C(2))-methylthiotransferase MtaB [Bacillales bacterium]
MKTFLIDFLGCKVNSYEVETIANKLETNGFKLFKNEDYPDVIILNTCSVTEMSSKKSLKILRKYKREFPKSILVVMGCDVQNNYMNYIEYANIIVGTTSRDKLTFYIDEYYKNKQQIIDINDVKYKIPYEELSLTHYMKNTRAYVKIQDGCNNFCTYCLIPYIRGRSRSRDKKNIIKEIDELLKNGYKEIILTGIDMCSYGQDFKVKTTFSDLLEEILITFPNLYRLRISSIEESQIDDKFIDLLSKYNNIANHLHLPLQSGSSSVLKNMNRKYNLDNFVKKVELIRKIRPDISITTDVIVGFPNESSDDFKETYQFCKKINFSKIHVFPYSDRTGTIASKMENKVSSLEKKSRVFALNNLSLILSYEYSKKFNDKEIEFLFENYDKTKKAYHGHSSNYLDVYYKSESNITGQVIKLKYFVSVKNNLTELINEI